MDQTLTAALADFAAAPQILIALDFDGCLAPFEADPARSRPLPESAAALTRLGREDGVQLALVSGRPAADLLGLASPPPGTWLVGSHGGQTGEVSADGALHLDEFALTTAQADLLADVTAAVAALADRYPGAWVEHKPAAVALHTRGIDGATAEVALAEAVAGPGGRPGVHPIRGNQVAELAVLEVTKGQALDRLRQRLDGARVLYAGDDVTDETALATLGEGDVGVKVGPAPTVAAYRVPDEHGVAAMLTYLADRRVLRTTP